MATSALGSSLSVTDMQYASVSSKRKFYARLSEKSLDETESFSDTCK